ncbi:hypothetical protein [Geodermatophilus nigrescens]|uniref:Uncharacterized protein n=1 Tax=Geodermatophilus nigrescens TaxID=1070870 RepID=A0A1M5D4W2_9ACTN|nr:hypothetical protein [Geodermatophilus nigrescens]SHF62028.1 hypothetical protein SAMN05444351_0223 [Geodermatophilus nigrescens]
MTALVIIGLGWLAAATALALVVGRGIRLADTVDAEVGPDLRREVDDVLAGLEDELRAAAATGDPA